MIPEFPEFKQLELSDKAEVEALTHTYPPYSDFEFASLYAWDVQEQTKLSLHHGNLIVRFADYLTGDFFYTFIGEHDVNDTAEKLLDRSRSEGLEPVLKLIPGVTAQHLDTARFNVVEDRDNFDYLISINALKQFDTKETVSRKKSVKKFLKDFPQHTISPLNLSDHSTVENIRRLIIVCNEEHPERGVNNELHAVTRLLKDADALCYLTLGIYLEDQLVGFVICNIPKKHIAMGHFIKGRRSISAHLYSYLLNKMAHMLDQERCIEINFEQDLGLEGLRKWKTSFGTPKYLEKYIVSFADAS